MKVALNTNTTNQLNENIFRYGQVESICKPQNKINVNELNQLFGFILNRIEIIVEKEENASY